MNPTFDAAENRCFRSWCVPPGVLTGHCTAFANDIQTMKTTGQASCMPSFANLRGCGASMRPSPISFVAVTIACNIAARLRRRTNLTNISQAGRLAVKASAGINTAEPSIDGEDVGDWLVRNGLAFDWPRYSSRRSEGSGARGPWCLGRIVCRAVSLSCLHQE